MGGQEQVNMVYFKLKEAVVVKELMDQVRITCIIIYWPFYVA